MSFIYIHNGASISNFKADAQACENIVTILLKTYDLSSKICSPFIPNRMTPIHGCSDIKYVPIDMKVCKKNFLASRLL